MKTQTFNRTEKKTEKIGKMEKAYNALQKRKQLEAGKKKEVAS